MLISLIEFFFDKNLCWYGNPENEKNTFFYSFTGLRLTAISSGLFNYFFCRKQNQVQALLRSPSRTFYGARSVHRPGDQRPRGYNDSGWP